MIVAKKQVIDDVEDRYSLEEILQTRDMYEKDREVLTKVQQELDKKKQELMAVQAKIDEISSQLQEKTTSVSTLKVTLDKEGEIKSTLEQQLADLRSRIEIAERDATAFKQAAGQKDGIIATKDALLAEKDKVIAGKDEQVAKLMARIDEYVAKMEAGAAKIEQVQGEIINLQKSNEQLRLKEKEANAKFQELNDKHEKLKLRMRDSGDSVLGTAMELEKLKQEIASKDAELVQLRDKLGSILTGTSGVITSADKLVEIVKQKVKETQRSVRLCLPRLAMVETIGLLPVLQGFPRTTVVNIASDIKATDEHLVLDLKARGAIFTQYESKDRWVLNRDSEDVILAMEKSDGNVIGFYSNEPKLVTMLNSAIMDPWVRGIKI